MTHVCTLYFVPEMCPWSAQIPRVDPSHKLTHICNNGIAGYDYTKILSTIWFTDLP
jgi:hypothetical protein